MSYTHYGWFGMCPIYLRDPFGKAPAITSRRRWLMPWLKFNIWLQQVAIASCSFVNPDWVPTWKMRLDGELSSPVSC